MQNVDTLLDIQVSRNGNGNTLNCRARNTLKERAHAHAFGPYLPDAAEPHEVVVEFSAEKAHLVSSREWHPTPELTELAALVAQVVQELDAARSQYG